MGRRRRIIVDPQTWLEVEVPDFATDVEALERSRRLSRGAVQSVRMEPDYGLVLPLWPADIEATTDIERRLPDDIVRGLMLWQAKFEDGYVVATAWRSDMLRNEWLAQGERLFAVVHEILWSDFEVLPSFRSHR
ncbi:hypothetical protein [Microbacterium thalli]|uniref:hypothetical protein n=1 Tax=Microbacterium thalli TaxID=3027921 RepID=UPI002365CEF4|nr:hypothetical protein [Microbacterium thalli]MDD7929627.1 hypothetical protein [Microbacterium thalli]